MSISSTMTYAKRYVDVLGKRMAYVEAGTGDPIIFFHGNITSSYMWRNVIPHVEHLGRCVAIDNIGQGDSDKIPGSMYRLEDHQPFVDALLDDVGRLEAELGRRPADNRFEGNSNPVDRLAA